MGAGSVLGPVPGSELEALGSELGLVLGLVRPVLGSELEELGSELGLVQAALGSAKGLIWGYRCSENQNTTVRGKRTTA